MDYSGSFSALNDRLRPRFTSSDQLYSTLSRLRNKSSSYRPTVLSPEPEPRLSLSEPEDPEEAGDDAAHEDSVSDGLEEENCADGLPMNNLCPISELSFKVLGEHAADEDSSCGRFEDKDRSGVLTSEGTGDSSESAALGGEEGNSFQKDYLDRTLPDLVNSGRPLSRRRTLGHVSNTLKEVRREVELSRRRSIKLKAQVDKLQESREGQGWSQHRERVKEEVLSILRLLHPLTEPESGPPELATGENHLDDALAQLQNVARKLALSHTQQEFKSGKGNGAEDSGLLQQALWDRDEAIEKKKAMETELLRSKTEMMMLNNHLLEAAQKRLELSLEVEAWKEDVQLILNQQLQMQQQAEQAQKKPSRMGLLRRYNKPPIQRPASIPSSAPAPPTTNTNQIFITGSAVPPAPAPSTPSTGTQRNWKDKLRMGKIRTSLQDSQPAEWGREGDGFQVVSLD